MRTLGAVLIAAGMLSFIFSLAGLRVVPAKVSSPEIALIAIGAGLLLVWVSERDRQRRKWKGLDNKPKYYD